MQLGGHAGMWRAGCGFWLGVLTQWAGPRRWVVGVGVGSIPPYSPGLGLLCPFFFFFFLRLSQFILFYFIF